MSVKRFQGPVRKRASRATRAEGRLVILGTGISIGQMTLEARAHVDASDCLLALVSDPIALEWLKRVNPHAESLHRFYDPSKPRSQTYREIVDYALSCLLRGREVCFVVYGHPGVFAYPSHELMRRATALNIPAKMLAGVSAEDCLFADLGIDPGLRGCQSFEATDFLLRQRSFDPTSVLILWQFAITGILHYTTERHPRGIRLLSQTLQRTYGPRHKVIIYEAAIYPMCQPTQRRIQLRNLFRADCSPMSTLCVPPMPNRKEDLFLARTLGIDNAV